VNRRGAHAELLGDTPAIEQMPGRVSPVENTVQNIRVSPLFHRGGSPHLACFLPQRIHGATGISSDISAAIKKEKRGNQSDFTTKFTKITKGRKETKGTS
jgi:hypothetical protein